jgi:hypothetical protein
MFRFHNVVGSTSIWHAYALQFSAAFLTRKTQNLNAFDKTALAAGG